MIPTNPFQLGSISTGTLKTEDLLPRFAEYLKSMDYENNGLPVPILLDRVREILESNMEDYESYAQIALDDFQDFFSQLSPPFVRFGAHPDDSADFGFWPDWAAINNELAPHWTNTLPDEPWEHYTGNVILRLPRRNLVAGLVITVMDLNHNILWSAV